jgi:hypothetical protein
VSEQPKGTALAAPKEKSSLLERLLVLAKTPQERERAFALAEAHQRNQIVQELVAEVKAKSWGDRVSPALRGAIVRWALDVGADPVDEVDILGGGPYLNARYWMRLCAAEPDFDHPEEVWVHDDPRATEEERELRRALRVKYAIPDTIDGNLGVRQSERKKDPTPVPVKAAVLVFGYFKGRGPFIGKKWSPSRANDDVGLDFPESTALTRAWRKMALQAVRQQPRVTDKLKSLMAQQERFAALGAGVPELGTQPVAQEPAPEVQEVPQDPDTTHAPTAFCAVEGPHPMSVCGYTKKKEPVA